MFSLTTITQVHSIVVSYVVWDETDLNLVNGNYILPDDIGIEISHSPFNEIGRSYARIFGITGFIILHKDQEIQFNTKWTGSKFLFVFDISRPLVRYLSYQYIFFMGSVCASCPGRPYYFDKKCYKYCPENTYASIDHICVDCGEGYYWNGTTCVKICGTGQILNIATNECDCPLGYFWNDFICLHCEGGRIYDEAKKVCQCPDGTKWNGYGCTALECKNG